MVCCLQICCHDFQRSEFELEQQSNQPVEVFVNEMVEELLTDNSLMNFRSYATVNMNDSVLLIYHNGFDYLLIVCSG